MKTLLLVLFAPLATPALLSQSFPSVQLIQPDVATGRPLLVATPCAEPSESGDFAWVRPITAYEDSTIGLYVDERCINVSALGFTSSGEYEVSLYTYYKDSDWPCKRLLPKTPTPQQVEAGKQWQTICKTIVYKVGRLEVDTKAEKYRMSRINLLDSHGYHLSSLTSSSDWHKITDLDRDADSRPAKSAIATTSKLVAKEAAYWTERLKQRQP
jgi:hypothetical protein